MYKDSNKKRNRRYASGAKKVRPFLFWDGEGVTHNDGEAQSYVLFGNSGGDRIKSRHLRTGEMLEFILQQSVKHKTAHHVSFSFGYDVNMILGDLSPAHFETLASNGSVYWGKYRIAHVPAKWIDISDGERSIRINDMFGFFQCSFIKALKSYIADDPLMEELAIIESGKAARSEFAFDEMAMIETYWDLENQLGQRLAEKLRELLHGVGFGVNQWHGPGAIANYIYKHNGIDKHKDAPPLEVRDAAAYAYAGGRFEMFNLGRYDETVYSIDINSAYPTAIANLPSLSPDHGFWRNVTTGFEDSNQIGEFGVYRIVLHLPSFRYRSAGPAFHRDEKDRISFPWRTVGWYWSPEARHLLDTGYARVIEGWEWIGDGTKPFSQFVPDYYYQRQELKAIGDGGEKALKLALNSLYGKMAQRVGWERSNGAPKWHRLEWAGFVTSQTRATLFAIMDKIPTHKLLGVETDGIYTTVDPATLGIQHSTELGGWDVSTFEEFMYLQSGVYSGLSSDGTWKTKYRGLDSGTLTSASMAEYLRNCKPGEQWPAITGTTTRFVGYRAARMSTEFHNRHNHWITDDKALQIGDVGKRVHVPSHCKQCKAGATPYETAHEMLINSVATEGVALSFKHHIPWEDSTEAIDNWRSVAELHADLLLG